MINCALVVFQAALHLALVALYFVSFFGKIVVNGWAGIFEHQTNWQWVVQMLFYTVTLPVPLIQAGVMRKEHAIAQFMSVIVGLFYFPLIGMAFVVAIVVQILLLTNSEFITVLIGHISANVVIVANDLFHIFTIIFMLLFFIAYRPFIVYSINKMVNVFDRGDRYIASLVFALVETFVFPAVPLALYVTLFDPRVIYMTDISILSGVLIVIMTLLATVFWPVTVVIYNDIVTNDMADNKLS